MTWTCISFLQHTTEPNFFETGQDLLSLPCVRVMVLHRKTGVLSRPLHCPQICNKVRTLSTLWLLCIPCSHFNYKNKSMHVQLYKNISPSLCTYDIF